MSLSDAERRFLERRRERTHIGLFLLPLALLLLLAVWVGLFVYWPLAINPVHAAVHYQGRTLEPSTITTYAVVVAVLLNVLLFAIGLAVLFAVLWARSERRYLRLLGRLVSQAKAAEVAPTPEKVPRP
jgi:hypothetical protein